MLPNGSSHRAGAHGDSAPAGIEASPDRGIESLAPSCTRLCASAARGWLQDDLRHSGARRLCRSWADRLNAPMSDNESRITARQVNLSAWIERVLWIGFLAPGVAYWLWRLV